MSGGKVKPSNAGLPNAEKSISYVNPPFVTWVGAPSRIVPFALSSAWADAHGNRLRVSGPASVRIWAGIAEGRGLGEAEATEPPSAAETSAARARAAAMRRTREGARPFISPSRVRAC